MCGINGILHFDGERRIQEARLIAMRDALEHRGPDDSGLFIDQNLGFGHRRLSILDVSAAGHQPFHSEDGRYVIIYNGEVYNFRDFYPELKAHGLECHTTCDTEVLLKLYQLYGSAVLPRLNGMFAFAIWDRKERSLFMARDRMGVKPLYYSIHDNSLFFASEQKALFTAGIPLQISDDGIQEYIFNRFVAGEKTLYRDVKKLLPGHYMEIDANADIFIKKWWNLSEEIKNAPAIDKPLEWFRETFDDSVRLRMVSDVPVGVLLSGGLDSSSVLASLKEQGFKNIESFNIGFSEIQHNEAHLAKLIAEGYGFGFHTMELKNRELYEKLNTSTYFQDEPVMHLSEPHLLAVSELAHPKVKVLLSGEGADELMGGYVRYKPLQFPLLMRSLGNLSGLDVFTKTARYEKLYRYSKLQTDKDLILYNGSNIYPPDIASHFGITDQPENSYRTAVYNEARELYPGNLRRQALYFDQHTYLCSLLDRNDRCTMGASIECREPFLDPRLIVGLGSLEDQWLFTGKKGKYILKQSMMDRLPSEIIKFRKIGLSAPWGEYLTTNPDFREEMSAFVNSDIFHLPFLGHIDIKKMVKALEAGDNRMVAYIVPLFMMHVWEKEYAKRFSGTSKWH